MTFYNNSDRVLVLRMRKERVENMKEKPNKIAKGKYTYRGYAIENLGPTTGYYGGTAFKPNRWKLVGSFQSTETLKFLCEDIDEWLDDPCWKDENGENKSPLKRAIHENNA